MPKGYRHSAEAREKIRQANLNRSPKSAETREKLRRSHTGKKHSVATLNRLRYIANLPHERERRRLYQTGRKHSPETIEKIRQGSHRAQIQFPVSERRKPVWTAEMRERQRRNRMRQRFPQKMTKLEQVLFKQFKKRRLVFDMHKTMFGQFQPDFMFGSVHLIVQADGDYWHRKLDVNKERDERFNDIANAGGWTVWRFAESEITNHPEACGRAVARFIRSH